jgi:hypothetical protein
MEKITNVKALSVNLQVLQLELSSSPLMVTMMPFNNLQTLTPPRLLKVERVPPASRDRVSNTSTKSAVNATLSPQAKARTSAHVKQRITIIWTAQNQHAQLHASECDVILYLKLLMQPQELFGFPFLFKATPIST